MDPQKKTPVARALAKPPKDFQLQEGVVSLRVLIPPDRLLGKDMVNC